MQSIVADGIRVDEDAEGANLSCRLTADGLDLPAETWYRFPRELAPFVSVNGDPFLPISMLLGMKERRNVVIEGDVSAELLESSRRIMGIFHAWEACHQGHACSSTFGGGASPLRTSPTYLV